MRVDRAHPRACLPAPEGLYSYIIFSFCLSESNHEIKKLLSPHSTIPIRSGIHITLDPGRVGLVLSRESLASSGVFVADSPHLINSNHELIVLLHNGNDDARYIEHGVPIATLIFLPYRL